MDAEIKTSDDILKELFSSINDIVGSSDESSGKDGTKIVVKKEKKAKRSLDRSSSKKKHKKKKKSKKSTKYSLRVSSGSKKKKKSSKEALKSSNSEYVGSKKDNSKRAEVKLPLIEVLKNEVIGSVPSGIPLPEVASSRPHETPASSVHVKLEKLDFPGETMGSDSALPLESPVKTVGEERTVPISSVADVFVEDMIEANGKSIAEVFKPPTDKQKKIIVIQNLEHSTVLEEAAKLKAALEESKRKRRSNQEEGEISGSSEDSSEDDKEEEKKVNDELTLRLRTHGGSELSKKKDSRRSHKKKKKKNKHIHEDSKEAKRKEDRHKCLNTEKILNSSSKKDKPSSSRTFKKLHRSKSKSREEPRLETLPHHSGTRRHHRSHSHDRNRRRSRSRSTCRRKASSKDRDLRQNLEKKDIRGRSLERKSKRFSRSRSRSVQRQFGSSSHSRHKKDEYFIDKGKLLEIARKNALCMMKQKQVGGNDMNKVVHITAGGKTVDQLTDFCKHLSQKDADGMESISSSGSSDEDDKVFHHPFKLKERPNQIIMNIRNCVPIPVKTHQEKATETLRLQFPVSSGQHHRKSESEWVPVSPKRTETVHHATTSKKDPVIHNAIEPPPITTVAPVNHYSTAYPTPERMNISDVISERLAAIRKEHDVPLRQQPGGSWIAGNPSGLFRGGTGARVLTPYELASGQQAWARKDQLISATPVSGMGMSLLQKMGWKPGEGLGKNHEGTLEPLKLPVKMDKKGLVCAEEMHWNQRQHANKTGPKPQIPDVKYVEGKHPVSLLVEFCTRRKYNAPSFTSILEEGPPHQKRFIFKVTVNGVDYQPAVSCSTKKLAKSEAAKECLRALGVLPNENP